MRPHPRTAVMGGEPAAAVLAMVGRGRLDREGKNGSAAAEAEFKKPVLDQYEREGHPYYASARLWDDGRIGPADTRKVCPNTVEAPAIVYSGCKSF